MLAVIVGGFALLSLIGFAFGEDAARGVAQFIVIVLLLAVVLVGAALAR